MKHTAKRISGFAIVEVLVAMMILGFGLVGISQMQGKVVKQNTLAKQRIDAINIAEGKLEELRNIITLDAYQSLASDTAIPTISADSTNNYSSDYTIKTTVTEDSSKKFKTVNVRVQWPDMSNNGVASKYTTFDISTIISSRRLPIAMDMVATTILPPSVTEPDIIKPLACECSGSSSVSDSSMGGRMMKNDSIRQDKFFIKVGGMMRTPSTSTSSSPSSNDSLCDTCCSSSVASIDNKFSQPEFMYAKSRPRSEWNPLQSVSPIQSARNSYYSDEFTFQKVMGGGGGGHKSSTSNTVAICGVTVNTSTPAVRYRCH